MGEQDIRDTNRGTMVEGSALEEISNEDSARDAAITIEELQRAQADTLTDDEFDEQSQPSSSSQIGGIKPFG